MCLSIPHKVIKVEGRQALVECHGHKHTLDISLIGKVKKGDYLLNENSYAIYKVAKKDALKTLKLFNDAQKNKSK